ncbi:hypothetical protein [Sorangium sp. So ce381]|uniref:hypothetical protein n=1 Tax=Sorangium sp. So ce381 TaxID=3133307 RepID=UPI003F5AE7B8
METEIAIQELVVRLVEGADRERTAALVQPGAMTACERRAVSKALRMERQRLR